MRKPLSPADMLFLALEGRRQPMHVGGLQLFELPADAPPNFITRLYEAAIAHDEVHRPFNRRLEFRWGRWFWVVDHDFELEHHVRHLSLPKPGRIRELLAMISRLHATPLDRSRPLWEYNIIEGLEDGRVAVYTKIHHALFDGVAAVRLGRESLSENPDDRHVPAMWSRKPTRHRRRHPSGPKPPSDLPSQIRKSLGGPLQIARGFGNGFSDVIRQSESSDDVVPFQAPPSTLNCRITSSRRFAAQSWKIARMRAVADATGTTLNDVALAMCGGALRKYLEAEHALPNEPLTAMVPVSIRTEKTADAGNQISVILANLATHLPDPLARLKMTSASTRHAKDRMSRMGHAERMAFAAASLSPMTLATLFGYDKVHPAFNIVISNVPGSQKPLYWNGARLTEQYPLSIPIDGQAMNITLTSYCDDMAFGFTACRRSLPSMQRLLEFTEQSLAELETATKTRSKT